jgi:hypothetical protein
MKRPRLDVNLEELDQIIERGTQAPLSESESEKLKSALHALAGMLAKPRTTEKTKNVLEQPETAAPESDFRARARSRTQRRRSVHWRKDSCGSASHTAQGRLMPRLRKRQSLPAERTPNAGAHYRSGSAGRHRI